MGSKHDEISSYFNGRTNRTINNKVRNCSTTHKHVLHYPSKPGEYASIDWKESMTFILSNGKHIEINIFAFVLSYSKYKIYYISLDKSQDILFHHLNKAFEQIDKAEILEFESLGFLERKENIVFLGPSGVGKTHLATAIGIAAAKHRYSTYFIKCHDLILQLNKAKIENRLEERLKHFTRYKLLIIDELGYLPIEKEESKLFFQLIDRRYESRSTIITTNINFSSWDETFKDPVIANAILDRILHHAKVVRIKGHSYRIKDHIQPKESDDQMHIDGY